MSIITAPLRNATGNFVFSSFPHFPFIHQKAVVWTAQRQTEKGYRASMATLLQVSFTKPGGQNLLLPDRKKDLWGLWGPKDSSSRELQNDLVP